ncbi:LysR family transcriptional regulator [Bacillus atrophaeus]|uniref:LysR family transcriptional regulator n=1 Tax=Bacillus atrophaeus TaxID=1452 RepID=UPI000779FC40|nr:LysR family transcriptional regulator [Bacillus atrophaeus]KXZ18196.1 LysR family transcriptional regulator [Bacillus atrophaeus]MCY7945258.1 LysR family transcriptional regulator [Bacillus atrophaeus]MCY8094831.1 LysR family transcriptional regulator [Bacillus atrophaeus]MCY8842791.1 LysR family transcriptional regulator [Bacillus atrophaeus]MCY8907542.1 LysR family transcriptional regulator [Bacillus atrophaeus]
MDIRQLRYFVTIAQEQKITSAAKKLHMAQPPLSRQLKQLEEELGVILFDRNKKKQMTLTYEGTVFLKRAKDILNKFEDAVIEVQELKEEVAGTLAVGSTIYCAALMLEKVTQIKEAYPHLTFNIWENEPVMLLELLESRQIDAAVTTTLLKSDSIQTKKLEDIPCVFIMSEAADNTCGDTINMEDIASFPLILLRTVNGRGVYDQVINEFKRLDLEPRIVCECHDSATLLSLVSSGFGATILPLTMIPLHMRNHIHTVHIEDNPFIMTPAVMWRKDSYLPKPVQQFLNLF